MGFLGVRHCNRGYHFSPMGMHNVIEMHGTYNISNFNIINYIPPPRGVDVTPQTCPIFTYVIW